MLHTHYKTIHLAHPQSDTHNRLLTLLEESNKYDKAAFARDKASYIKIALKITEIISKLPSRTYIVINTHPTKLTPVQLPGRSTGVPHITTYIAQVVTENHPIWKNGNKYIATEPIGNDILISPQCKGKNIIIIAENKKAAQGIEATLEKIGATEVITIAIT